MIRHHLRIAWRNIRQQKVYTFIKITSLSIGICVCIIVFLQTKHEFSYDRFHPDAERIYHLGSQDADNTDFVASRVPCGLPAVMRKEMTGLESVVQYYSYSADAKVLDSSGKERHFNTDLSDGNAGLIITDRDYFKIFQYHWLAGDPSTSLEEPNRVVLSVAAAHAYFGDAAPSRLIGRPITYNDSLTATVSGIVQDWTEKTDFPFREFLSFSTIDHSFLKSFIHTDSWLPMRGSPEVWSFVKLSGHTSPAQISIQLAGIVKRHLPEARTGMRLTMHRLTDVHFDTMYSHDDIRKAYRPVIYGSIAVAILILVIAIINFINLSVAQAGRRIREIGVRKVLGSGRRALIAQFLTETLILVLLTTLLAVLLVNPALHVFRDYLPPTMRFDLLNPGTLTFLLSVILATTLAAGYYPAAVLSSYQPVLSLKGQRAQEGIGGWWLKRGFIVFQFTISLVFIMCAILVNRQIGYMLHTDFGFKTDAILTIRIFPREKKPDVLAEEIRHIPGVAKVIEESTAPLGWAHFGFPAKFKGRQEVNMMVSADYGNEEFIPFYQMRLLAGRNIVHSDSLREIVVNETLAKSIGAATPADAIGKVLYQEDQLAKTEKALPIVGVVADFHEQSFHQPIGPVIIGHLPDAEKFLGVKLASTGKDASDVRRILKQIEARWKENYTEREIDLAFFDESVRSFYDKEVQTSDMMKLIVAVSIFISCIGLYGLSMFAASQRRKEMGIRKVLGATVADLLVLLNREFVYLILLALLIASPLAVYCMHWWLQDFVYRVSIGWTIFALAGSGALMIALVTVSFHAIRAATANPVKSLRTE